MLVKLTPWYLTLYRDFFQLGLGSHLHLLCLRCPPRVLTDSAAPQDLQLPTRPEGRRGLAGWAESFGSGDSTWKPGINPKITGDSDKLNVQYLPR